LRVAAVAIAALALTSSAGAQDVEAELAIAIEAELTLGSSAAGARVHVLHCRRAEGGCAARARQLARLFVGAGARHEVDPYLLAAIALKESGLDSRAVGAVGELGLMQLHPRSPWGRRARAECARAPADCDWIVVDAAAALLAAARRRCEKLPETLGAYNTGRCVANPYSGRVLRLVGVLSGHVQTSARERDAGD
jgi:hypothetical protein